MDLLLGQMFMVGFSGTEFSSEHLELLKEVKPSGIVFFGRNMVDAEQVKELIFSFKKAARILELPPLLVALDYEGGKVFRMAKGLSPLPSAMALGATDDLSCVRTVASIAGRELRWMGFNVNFAPVADVNTNWRNPVIGIRSFGDDPLKVASFVSEYVSALQSNGIMAVAKHFPGHGDSSVDSHLDLPVVDIDMSLLLAREILPFKAAIKAGVSSIMTAHVVYPKLDASGLPATLSNSILSGILRELLGFKGVVFSDALEMKAIYDRYAPEEIVRYAVNAGVDVLLPCSDYDFILQLRDGLKKSVEAGIITEDRLMESYMRLEKVRSDFNLYHSKLRSNIRISRCLGKHKQDLAATASRSITLVGAASFIDSSIISFIASRFLEM